MTRTLKLDSEIVFMKLRQKAMPRRSCRIQIHLKNTHLFTLAHKNMTSLFISANKRYLSSFLYTPQITAMLIHTAARTIDLTEKFQFRTEKLDDKPASWNETNTDFIARWRTLLKVQTTCCTSECHNQFYPSRHPNSWRGQRQMPGRI